MRLRLNTMTVRNAATIIAAYRPELYFGIVEVCVVDSALDTKSCWAP